LLLIDPASGVDRFTRWLRFVAILVEQLADFEHQPSRLMLEAE
jgi:hypothetical protein